MFYMSECPVAKWGQGLSLSPVRAFLTGRGHGMWWALLNASGWVTPALHGVTVVSSKFLPSQSTYISRLPIWGGPWGVWGPSSAFLMGLKTGQWSGTGEWVLANAGQSAKSCKETPHTRPFFHLLKDIQGAFVSAHDISDLCQMQGHIRKEIPVQKRS